MMAMIVTMATAAAMAIATAMSIIMMTTTETTTVISNDSLPLLRRLWDQGDLSELAAMPADVHHFVQTVNHLLLRRPAGCLATGFTAYALVLLEQPRAFFVGGSAKTLGGANKVTMVMLSRCLSRMVAWVRLAIECIDYEFPDWHLLLAVSVFDL